MNPQNFRKKEKKNMASYNLKVFEYKEFVQYRFYSRTIKKNDDDEIIDNDICSAEDERTQIAFDEDMLVPFDGTPLEKCVDLDNLPTAEELEERKNRSMEVSVNRTVQTIYGYAQSNKWDWFVTLTFRRDLKFDVKDYDSVVRKLTGWLHDQRKKCPDLKYLFVPEKHKNGAWHFHGLIANADKLSFTDSRRVAVGNKAYLRTENNKEYETIYNMDNWKYGFSTATKIVSSSKASSYICKYITKDVIRHSERRRRFYASNNLDKPVVSEYLFNGDDLDDLLESMSEDINYIKTQTIEDAKLIVKYVQIMKGGVNSESEKE